MPPPVPTVSVIILSYNRAHYLSGAVESVFSQTFRDFEIIIVDDGSQDNAPEIAQDYAARYDNIRFISHKKNAGIMAAIKTGVSNARGELITILDDDDLFHPDKLEHQVTLMQERNDIDACTTNFAFIGEEECPPIGEKERFIRFPYQKSKWIWAGVGGMYRRAVYEKLLKGNLEYFRLADDLARFLLFDMHYHYECIDEVLYYYRRPQAGRDNLSESPKKQPLDDLFYRIAAFVNRHCLRHGIANPVETGKTIESILCISPNLPADERFHLLHRARNAGKRILADGKNIDNSISSIKRCLKLLGGGECQRQTVKYRRWLALQSLRYGKLKIAWMFIQMK